MGGERRATAAPEIDDDLPVSWHRPTDPAGAFVDGPALLVDGAGQGPLLGSSVVVKDLLDVAGRVTGAGNPVLARRRAPASSTAPAVARLLAAGAHVAGRTVTDELAYSLSGTNVHLGTPRNAAWPGHEPGGSSSGSAAAVAAGSADVGVGTDTGGSVRVPASACRLLGWRPTHGLVPAEGVFPLAPSFDVVGAMAAPGAAALLRAAADAMAGGLVETGPPSRVVIAEDLLGLLEPGDAADVAAAAARVAGALGLPCDRRALLDVDPAVVAEAFRHLQGAEAWRVLGDLVTDGDLRLGPGIEARFTAAAAVSPVDEAAGDVVRHEVERAVAAATAGSVVVALPAAGGPPLRLGSDRLDKERWRARTLAVTAPAGLARAPVVVLPCRPPGSPPLGLALLSAVGSDAMLLDALVATSA